jgi:prephenate dehydrogenase
MRLAIVGLGLIGGSLAAAAKSRLGAEIWAVDRPAVLASALAQELADERVSVDESQWSEALRTVDLVVLATPVQAIVELLAPALEVGRTVTDCGSTKRRVARRAQLLGAAARFVPGHPMAGAPEGGLANARADLFVGRRWIVCPESCDADRADQVARLARGVGAEVVEMTAVEHDRVVALTSHVPQILSSALAVLGDRRQALSGVGPAYLSVTKRAGGQARMWGDIFATNHDEIAAALWDVAQELEAVAAGLDRDDPDLEPVLRLLERARNARGS